MLKLLLNGSGGDSTYFPNSGPGSKYLKTGGSSLGFFGEVTSSELFDGWEIANKINKTGVVFQKYSGLIWLKYFVDGKVIYIAREQVLSNVTWNQIYNSGAAYGEAGDGPYPSNTPVSQLNVLSRVTDGKTWYLKLRLPKGASKDPYIAAEEVSAVTEWSRTILNSLSTSGVNRLASYNPASLCYGGVGTTLAMESISGTTTSNLVLGGSSSNLSTKSAVTKNTVSYWRPVLELINPNNSLLPLQDVVADKDDLLPPSISTDITQTSEFVMSLVNVGLTSPIEPYVENTQLTGEYVYGLKDLTITTADKPDVSYEIVPW